MGEYSSTVHKLRHVSDGGRDTIKLLFRRRRRLIFAFFSHKIDQIGTSSSGGAYCFFCLVMDITSDELLTRKALSEASLNVQTPGLSCCAVSVGEKRKRSEDGETGNHCAGYRGAERGEGSEGAGLKFNDFKKLREESNFEVGQTWALYDDDKVDGMPRLYARIRKVSAPSFELRITYLEPDPDDELQIQWLEKDLPASAGQFKLGKHHNTQDSSIFSNVVHCKEGSNTGHLTVSPIKGETWALFKNWDINWSSEPDSHHKHEYEFVEILSDYADETGVSVAFLRKAKGFASVFFRMGTGDADTSQILPHNVYQFSHKVPSFRLTGVEAKGLPKDAYELDQAALPERVEDINVPSHLLAKPTASNSGSTKKTKPQTIYFASKGNVFQIGQIWSFSSGHEFPLYYGKIQKITFTQVLHQEAVYKLHVSRLKPARFPLDVIQYVDKEMPAGCGTFYARNALEIITTDDVSHQVIPETSMDGNEYTILPKIGEVWVIHRFWSEYQEFSRVGFGSYNVVQILDDTLGYKVLLLERESSSDDYEESLLFREVKEYKNNEIDGSEPIFTITNSKRLRFSHRAPARRVTREIYGELKDLIEVDSGALPFNVTRSELGSFN